MMLVNMARACCAEEGTKRQRSSFLPDYVWLRARTADRVEANGRWRKRARMGLIRTSQQLRRHPWHGEVAAGAILIAALLNEDTQQCLTLYGLQDRHGVVGDRSLSFGVAEI
jgi:hypothetical protein